MVAESTFYKGTSKETKLLQRLIERMRGMKMDGLLFVHLVWISGKRMMEQGIDGVSRGNLDKGALAGNPFLLYVPLNKTVLEKIPDLKLWVEGIFDFKLVSRARSCRCRLFSGFLV